MFGKLLKVFGCCCAKKTEAPKPQLSGLKLNKQQVKPSLESPSFTGQTTESIGCWLYASERAGSPQEVTPLAVEAFDDEELGVQPTQRDD
ncbi:unnamed protein product [Caenorhabditis angaria]|uniref:Uncharacterized protein n=1 Tax=Caenorhabditis angaria TaxID=860376 RepID=A0A9P1J568_9PELO|nr:unnamed protein product [Caenorhabditis angaria]